MMLIKQDFENSNAKDQATFDAMQGLFMVGQGSYWVPATNLAASF